MGVSRVRKHRPVLWLTGQIRDAGEISGFVFVTFIRTPVGGRSAGVRPSVWGVILVSGTLARTLLLKKRSRKRP